MVDYNLNIPDGPNNPSNDQRLMKENTNAIDTILAVDHISFNANNGGMHKQITFSDNQAAPGFGTGVSDLFSNVSSGNAWPFWQNALGSFLLAGPNSIAGNGYITILNGLIIQWGRNATSGLSTNIAFPLTFPTSVFTVVAITTVGDRKSAVTAQSTTEFTFSTESAAVGFCNWAAFGN